MAACSSDAEVRFVHAAPGAPAIDVYVDNDASPLVTDLVYGQASPYVDVDSGDHALLIRDSGSHALVYTTVPLTISENDEITAVATGDVSSTDAADAFRLIPLYEAFAGTRDREARVRIVHASPDAPTVAIDVGDDASFEISSLDRFDDTGVDGIVLPADIPLQIGIGIAGVRATAFTTPVLPSNGDIFLIATGNIADLPRLSTGFSLLAVGHDGVIELTRQNPTIYAVHASPDAPAVDIRAGTAGATLYSNLTFGQMAPAQVPPGDYTLAFFRAGDLGNIPVATAPVSNLAAGERYLAVATGMLTAEPDEQRFQLATYQEQFTLDDNPRIRAIHASPDAPTVDVSTATGDTLDTPPAIAELGFLESSPGEGLAVPMTPTLRIGIAPAKSTATVATFNLSTTSKPRAFEVAAGALSAAPGEAGFRLLEVNTATSPWSIATVAPNQR